MFLYLGFGVLVLALGLLLLRAFAQANPAKLARGARTALFVAAASVALIALFLFVASDRIGFGVVEIMALAPIALRALAIWRQRQAPSGAQPGQASEVETDYLRMRLDHDTGAISGTVRRGPHRGRDLGELSHEELVALWRECRAEDVQGAKLLEAYLDHAAPDWREASEAKGSGSSATGAAMTKEEALAVLGLANGAGEAEIREAYHRLMKKIHPDRGGSAYLAAKLNQARELLLG
jgi:hypothetical protein